MGISSRPPRARGLKLEEAFETVNINDVAPPAGAWIETTYKDNPFLPIKGRAPRGRVD